MAPSSVLENLQAQMTYYFKNVRLLETCLLAGDTNADDREGHRGIAQLGDSLMGTVILSDGLERGHSRKDLNDAVSEIRSKKLCGRIAKVLRLHEWVKTSERQVHIGIQPTTLKNAVAALIGAVWLDAHDYEVVLRVMISIGLMNHVKFYDGLRDTLSMHMDLTWSPDSFDALCNEITSNELDHDYWSLLPDDDSSHEHSFQTHPMYSSTPAIASTSAISVASPRGTAEDSSSSPDSSRRVEGEEPPTRLTTITVHSGTVITGETGLDSQDLVAQAQQRMNQDKLPKAATRGDGRVTKSTARKVAGKGPGRPRRDSSSCIIREYVNREVDKDATSQEHARITGSMSTYLDAILRAPETSQLPLAVLATSIGDCSALLILKEAVQGLRSPSNKDCLCIDRQMTVPERIRIIEDIGAFTALFRLVRLLHIVALWEDVSQKIGDSSDRFVLVTPDLASQSTPRKGNPRNLARTEIAQGLCDPLVSQDRSSQDDRKSTRLRRLGQRLGFIAARWGQGALLMLGQGLSENRILTSTDGAFEALIALIDQHEGARISAVSAAAFPILQDFRQGRQPAVKLGLECVDEDGILSLPRLSSNYEVLLKAANEQ